MLPQFIESWHALPRAGEAHLQERIWFDVKETYPPNSKAEMAKDIAAFANAVGGAIIVGAKEGSTEPDYSNALSSEYAERVENEFDEAVRDYCRPSPTVHIRAIPVPGEIGKVILVVNIEPSVEQPVAARHSDNNNAWRFPVRVGRHTEFLFPEQLPEYMNSKTRRTKLLLLRILEAGGAIDLFTVPDGLFRRGDIQGPGQFDVETVDQAGGGAFVMKDASGDLGRQRVTVPIDDVEAIWLQHTGRWAVRLAGYLEQFTGPGYETANTLEYIPPSTYVVSPLERVLEDMSKRIGEIGKLIAGTLVVQHHARVEPSGDAIAQRAHRIWQQRVERSIPGSAEEDWHRARRQLLTEQRNS